MAYRKVSEEEFKKWARRNPGMTARIDGQEIQTPVPQAQDLGFLGNLARGVTKPLRTVAAMPEYLVQALQASSGGQTEMRPGQFKSIFLTPEEEIKWARDPVKEGLKSSVGLGAYLVPGGGGAAKTTVGKIGTAAGRGTISGTMSGLGYSDDGDELQNMLTGGLFGGAFGAATQGIGEAGRAIQAKRQIAKEGGKSTAVDYLAKQRGEAIGLDPNKIAKARGTGVSSATEGEKTIRSFFDSLDELGLPSNTSNKASLSADQALGYYGENFNRLLAQTNNPVLGADTTKNILQSVKREVGNNPSVLRSSIYKELNTDLLGLGQSYTPVQLNAVREKARNMINWSSSGKMPQSERAARAFFDSLDDTFKGTKTTRGIIPESAGILGKMRDIYTVRPFVQGKAVNADFIPVGTASAHVKLPTLGINEALQSGVGKVGETLQGVGTGGSALSKLFGAAPVANIAQRATPGIVGAAQSLPGRQEQPQLEGLGGMLPPQEQGPQIDESALINAVLSGQISRGDAEWLMEMLGGGAGGQAMPKTDSGRKAMVARDAALQALNILEQDPSAAGKLQGLENLFYDITGQANTATEYKTQIEGLRSQVFNALGGTALSPTEKAQYEKFLPKQNDSPAQARQKLQILIPMMESLMGAEVPSPDSNAAITNIMPWIAQ